MEKPEGKTPRSRRIGDRMPDVIANARNSLRFFLLLALGCANSRLLAMGQDVVASGQKPARVAGKVCTALGDPIADAVVQLWPGELGGALAEIHTDRYGKFALIVSRAGKYQLLVAKAGFQNTVLPETEVVAGEDKLLDIVLKKAASGNAEKSAAGGMQLSDEPNFTVAGVTDWSNVGLHGSDANVRTSESLAKETATLKSGERAVSSRTAGEAESHRLLGDAKEKSGDPVGAVNEYEKAVKIEPSEENYFAWGSELLLHRAGIAAVEVFHKGAEQYPKSARMRVALGAAYHTNGQYAEAAANLCEASDLNPADPQPYLFLGRMEIAATELLGCSDEKLRRFVTLQPQNPLANDYYGFLLWKQGRQIAHGDEFSRAESYYKKAIALDPKLGEVYLHLGMLYNARGDKNAALRAFEQGVAANPKLSAAHYQLSLAYRRAGESGKAEQQMKLYEELKHSEDVEVEKERREIRQFVTTSKEKGSSEPH
jgi:tetratricopeptide (TPR) repeat protein